LLGETVYLALGSNLGDRLGHLVAAARALPQRNIDVTALSGVYETDAVADEPQPPYLNAVLRATTTLDPKELLATVLNVEHDLGRRRPPGRFQAPRTVDVDILLYGALIWDVPGLCIPHARLLERPFVRIPLADVACVGLAHPRTDERLDQASPHPGVRPFASAASLSKLVLPAPEAGG